MSIRDYIIGALGVALLLGALAYQGARGDLRQEKAEHELTALALVNTQTDLRAAGAGNDEWRAVAARRLELLNGCQADGARIRAAGDKAVTAAEAKAARIERAFERFAAQFDRRPAQCDAALQAADAACADVELY